MSLDTKFDNEILFVCDCSSCEHQLIARWDNTDKEIYVSVHLSNHRGFWARLLYGLKYAFGYKCAYGAFEEIILRIADADSIQKIVDHLRKAKKSR